MDCPPLPTPPTMPPMPWVEWWIYMAIVIQCLALATSSLAVVSIELGLPSDTHGLPLYRGWLPDLVRGLIQRALLLHAHTTRAFLTSWPFHLVRWPNAPLFTATKAAHPQFARLVDDYGAQWFHFVRNLPIMGAFMVFFATVHALSQRVAGGRFRAPTAVVLSLIFVLVAFGAVRSGILLGILALSYAWVHGSWIVGGLVSRDPKKSPRGPSSRWHHWVFYSMLLVVVRLAAPVWERNLGLMLGVPVRGPMRIETTFNLVMLRLLSYAIDVATYGGRPGDAITISWASISSYVEYVLYPPLLLTGPIMAYEDFTSQRNRREDGEGSPRATTTTKPLVKPVANLWRLAWYGLRALLSILLHETMLHFIYPGALAKDPRTRQVILTRYPVLLAAVGFYALISLWLRFMSIWRTARFLALLDGINPPENMRRCICNNISIPGFWRDWHASFYRWLLRYVYVPLGGRNNQLVATLVTFMFVALWHEVDVGMLQRLLLWAGMMAVGSVLVALSATRMWKREKQKPNDAAAAASVAMVVTTDDFASLRRSRAISSCWSAAQITMLVTANQVGFVFGTAPENGWAAFATPSYDVVFTTAYVGVVYYALAQLMTELRARETRRGGETSMDTLDD